MFVTQIMANLGQARNALKVLSGLTYYDVYIKTTVERLKQEIAKDHRYSPGKYKEINVSFEYREKDLTVIIRDRSFFVIFYSVKGDLMDFYEALSGK